MTPEEFKKEVEDIIDRFEGDPEAVHGKLDDLCWRVLSELGYGAGVVALCAQTKWYA